MEHARKTPPAAVDEPTVDVEQEPAPEAAGGDGALAPPRVRDRRPLYAGLLVAAIVAAVVAVVELGSGSSAPSGPASTAVLTQVPTNHVTGSGHASIQLNGDQATVTVTTEGLDNGANLVHLMHIHAGGKGECPPASAAQLHNGHLAISTGDGARYYGAPVQSLTTHGDTSVASILAFPRFPSGGALRYTRTITLPPEVVAAIVRDNALIVIHGTDYDGTGIYSGVLDRSELDRSVPATATAPALCGPLIGASLAGVSSPHAGTRTLLYTASLAPSADAQPVSVQETFLCHFDASGDGVGEARQPIAAETKARSAAA